jgi:predicted enzyme related to lactoylglutathione lyase
LVRLDVAGYRYYVRVGDVNEAANKVRQNGGLVANGPMEVPGGDWIAQCLDPAGGMFALHQKSGDSPAQ